MARTAWRTAIAGFLLLLATCSEGLAAYVGDRFFPSTLATTVPTPADFYNPPYFVKLPNTATTREIDIPSTYSRLVTRDLAVFFTETFRILDVANKGRVSGFDNLVIGTQYQLCTDAAHQFVFTVGGTAAIGGTGSSPVAASFSTVTPTVYIGKGFGDLPDSMAWLRPLTLSAMAAVAVPTDSSSLTTTTLPTGMTTLSETINPKIQVGVEAIIPMDAHSGRDLGVRAQAHLYLPAIFPDFYGKPIFGK
jgi:hypothetical protein